MFQGKCIRVTPLDSDGIYELCFDRQGESINKFDDQTVEELRQATQALSSSRGLRGVLATSAKNVFIVGADITEFGRKFMLPAEQITADVLRSNEVFNAFEELQVPTVVAINGFALGGGLEFALACTFRVMSSAAQVGVPEVKLGLFPGFGGTVRLVRLAGPTIASAWVATGKPASAQVALETGIIDEIAAPEQLSERALDWLLRATSGELDLSSRRERKRRGITMSADKSATLFASARAAAGKAAGPHQPAAIAAIDMMERGAFLERNEALLLEATEFGHIARTQAASALVQTFLNDQAIKRSARQAAKGAAQVRSAAVLGAGIMGGGIAFVSALRGIPVRVRDIRGESLEQAKEEASKQIAKQVKSGRLNEERGAEVLRKITTQLDFAGFDTCDFVIEAIIEDLDIKRQVISDLEARLAPSAFLASNTSSLRIDDIASCLKDPTRLVGMHFFNPVPQMPLVEIVRGTYTSEAAVAAAVAYASAIGKTPIVVRDCPGFLVNRVLTAYMRGFLQLVNDGADFKAIDKAMEAFGWPMGPAYLEDVVGIDTGSHVNDVISSGYPERMQHLGDDALRLMKRLGRYGQKSGIGFYRYERNAQGKPIRSLSDDTVTLLKQLQPNGPREFSEEEIVNRMMLPMVLEAARALDEGVAASAAELDMAITLGLGFPGYAGGPLKYADWLSLPEVIKRCEKLSHLGTAYQPSVALRSLAAANGRFH